MKNELRFDDLPHWWAICTDTVCPLRDRCLRRHAATLAPPAATSHLCIIPHDRGGQPCPHFVEQSTVRLARGFEGIFTGVHFEHRTPMKLAIMAYLGGTMTNKGTYYRYLRGERLLSPEQQAWICRLMERYGYSPDVRFDSYVDDYIFKAGRPKP